MTRIYALFSALFLCAASVISGGIAQCLNVKTSAFCGKVSKDQGSQSAYAEHHNASGGWIFGYLHVCVVFERDFVEVPEDSNTQQREAKKFPNERLISVNKFEFGFILVLLQLTECCFWHIQRVVFWGLE